MKRYFLIGVVLMAFGCEDSGDTQSSTTQVIRGPKAEIPVQYHALYDSIMMVHDEEAMPLYEPTVSLKMEIKRLYDSTMAMSSEDVRLIQQLSVAGDSMMVWMREFEQDFEGWPSDSLQSYLESELERIGRINDQMRESIEAAKGRLENE